jgi:hypothetical protein
MKEYRIILPFVGGDKKGWEDTINESARDGWQVVPNPCLFIYERQMILMEREIPEAKTKSKPMTTVRSRKKGLSYECGCVCHHNELVEKYGPATHSPNPCSCEKCPFCGKNIQSGRLDLHIEQVHPPTDEQPECARGQIVSPLPHPSYGVKTP